VESAPSIGPATIRERTVKYMLIMRATDEGFAAFAEVDFEEIMETMDRFNDEMINAGAPVSSPAWCPTTPRSPAFSRCSS
jgi:hypothetical protein